MLNLEIRHHPKYQQWVSDVLKRDNWTCQACHRKEVYLIVHHLKPFTQILEENNIKTLEEALQCKELWDTDNGITLCENCHKQLKNSKIIQAQIYHSIQERKE
jgi:5-methylcytosine-specific restriction endonuclease McrA